MDDIFGLYRIGEWIENNPNRTYAAIMACSIVFIGCSIIMAFGKKEKD